MKKEFYYRVKCGETIRELKEKFNTDIENILRNNKDIDLYAGEWVKIKQNDYKIHIVKPTETINLIADLYGITSDKLLKDNELISEKLFIGQILKIK